MLGGNFEVDSGLEPLNFRNTIDKRSFAIKDGAIDIDLDIGLSIPSFGDPYFDLSEIEDFSTLFGDSGSDVFIPSFVTDSFNVNLPMFTYDGAKYIQDLGFDAVGAGLDPFNFDFGNGVAYRVKGGYLEGLQQALPQTRWYCITQEYGTFASLKVLRALRNENAYHHSAPEPDPEHPTKLALLQKFCPGDLEWRYTVLRRSRELLDQATKLAFGQS